jgi:PAT family beta-lactamase induction signal transducer AmpG
VYLVMAACMLVGLAASVGSPEPERASEPPKSLAEAVRGPFQEILRRLGVGETLAALGFIAVYKMGDNVVANMTIPFLLQTGFTQTDIGAVQGVMGTLVTTLGLLVGGGFMSRLGILRSLWIFGLLQAATNIGYWILAELGRNYPMMVLTLNLEFFAQGLGTVALVGFLMHLCNPRFSATQYALLSSLIAVSRDLGSAPSGAIADWAGWPVFFALSIVLAGPGLALAWRMQKKERSGPGETGRAQP